VFHTYVASVLFVCCKRRSRCCITCMLQAYVLSVSDVSYVCCKCFNCLLQVDLDVACICNGFQVFLGVLQVF
jgi:hypothetical protein